MSEIGKMFSEHPQSVGENYWQHMRSAATFSAIMLMGSVVCLVHALLPFLFTRTGSQCVESLYKRMISGRNRALYDARGERRHSPIAPSTHAQQTAQ